MEKIERYIEKIKENYPNIDVKSYERNTIGQNNDIIIINNEYVFRFPKYQNGIKTLKVETEVLESIKEYITLNIPNPKYNFFKEQEVGQVFAGYKMMFGKPLWKNTFMNIKNKKVLANQLANFLKELHSISSKEVENIDIPVCDSYEKWSVLFNKIREKLYKYMSGISKQEVEKNFEKFLGEKENFHFQHTLTHGDFGPTNILFNEKTQRISGIIDFGSISFDDPAIDFAALIGPFGYGESFVRMFHEIYPNIDSLIKRAKFYASTFPLQEALFGLENGDREAFNDGIAQYI